MMALDRSQAREIAEWIMVAFLLILVLSYNSWAAPAIGTMANAPSLSQRNYYTDEVRLVNHCVPHWKMGDPLPPGFSCWGDVLHSCDGQGRLETDYGALIAANVSFMVWDGLLTGSTEGRINGLYGAFYKEYPAVAPINYSRQKAEYYAYGVASEINTAMNGMPAVSSAGTCVSVLVPQLWNSTWNAIRLQHYAYPYMHAIQNANGWCFEKP